MPANAPLDEATAEEMLGALPTWLSGGALEIVDVSDAVLVSIPLGVGVGVVDLGALTFHVPIDNEAALTGDAVSAWLLDGGDVRRIGPIVVGIDTSSAPVRLQQATTTITAGAQVTVDSFALSLEDLTP